MKRTQKSSIGSLRISKDVIMSIAQAAATEVSGVAGLPPTLISLKNISLKKWALRPVTVTITDDIALIDIYVIVNHGARIPVVAKAVQVAVKESVQSMTGITVSKVNVAFSGINFINFTAE